MIVWSSPALGGPPSSQRRDLSLIVSGLKSEAGHVDANPSAKTQKGGSTRTRFVPYGRSERHDKKGLHIR